MISHRYASLLIAFCALGGRASAQLGDGTNGGEPLFTRHVEAIFSRLGCNGGTCHGAVKGQNGFKLSLFAANPDLDHDHLLHDSGGRRLNLLAPAASLLLLKATGQAGHQGGKRMNAGSFEYEVLRRWMAAGAPIGPAAASR